MHSVSFKGNIMEALMDAVINGVDNLFHEPAGCGEQTMIRTAPVVYGMSYLRQTGKVTQHNEVQGTAWIKQGMIMYIVKLFITKLRNNEKCTQSSLPQ